MSKEFYTPAEAAAVIGINERSVLRRIHNIKIPAHKAFGVWQIAADVVEAERQRVASKSSKKATDARPGTMGAKERHAMALVNGTGQRLKLGVE